MSSTIIIPARLDSSRLPGKALEEIVPGVPMVVYTAVECFMKTGMRTVVATDSPSIANVCKVHGVDVQLTGKHETGTDRVNEAAQLLGLQGNDLVINVQGDCPFVNQTDLMLLAFGVESAPDAVHTLAKRNTSEARKWDPDVVKVVQAMGKAMYFSRAPIPWDGDSLEHIGIYAFTAETLNTYCSLPRSELEIAENIEHLRALENGIDIHLIETTFEYVGVNNYDELYTTRILANDR